MQSNYECRVIANDSFDGKWTNNVRVKENRICIIALICLKRQLSSCLRPRMHSKCMVIVLILIYDFSSALLIGSEIAMKVILYSKICEI